MRAPPHVFEELIFAFRNINHRVVSSRNWKLVLQNGMDWVSVNVMPNAQSGGFAAKKVLGALRWAVGPLRYDNSCLWLIVNSLENIPVSLAAGEPNPKGVVKNVSG